MANSILLAVGSMGDVMSALHQRGKVGPVGPQQFSWDADLNEGPCQIINAIVRLLGEVSDDGLPDEVAHEPMPGEIAEVQNGPSVLHRVDQRYVLEQLRTGGRESNLDEATNQVFEGRMREDDARAPHIIEQNKHAPIQKGLGQSIRSEGIRGFDEFATAHAVEQKPRRSHFS